jgi:hypothetical protein
LTFFVTADRLRVAVEQRKTRRFKLQLPVHVLRAGKSKLADAGFTKDISSCGVRFTAARELELGTSIEYVITLIDELTRPVNLRCIGKIVRQQSLDDGAADVAATVERYQFVRPKEN